MSADAIDDDLWEKLARAAQDAAERAHAPYSKFHVGAALLGADGEVYTGCNIENATFGATVCAERHAVAAGVLAGVKDFEALAVHCPSEQPVAPCGICRQVLAEFCDRLPILLLTESGDREFVDLDELLPHRFGATDFT